MSGGLESVLFNQLTETLVLFDRDVVWVLEDQAAIVPELLGQHLELRAIPGGLHLLTAAL